MSQQRILTKSHYIIFYYKYYFPFPWGWLFCICQREEEKMICDFEKKKDKSSKWLELTSKFMLLVSKEIGKFSIWLGSLKKVCLRSRLRADAHPLAPVPTGGGEGWWEGLLAPVFQIQWFSQKLLTYQESPWQARTDCYFYPHCFLWLLKYFKGFNLRKRSLK